MSICRKLLETLKAATVERQVEDAYNEMLKAEFPGLELTYPYGCDGYFEFDADEAGLDTTYAEANAASDRYMVKALADAEPYMSDEARTVLTEARRLVRASMKYRELFDDEHPEYQVRTFDAGWYQIKAVLKEYMPEELKKFRELTKKLADCMRPAVYELSFLRK